MKIGFGFFGITDGTDVRTGYSRNYKHCWNGIQKYLIQGNFESNFISIKTEVETKKKILAADGRYKLIDKNSNNTIELVGRHIITEAKIIKSLPKGIEDKKDAFRP